MADRNKGVAIEALLADLEGATIGKTFNLFREVGPDDVPAAPAIRLANLRHYLAERAGSDVVADSNTISDAETGQGVRETCSIDGLDAIADGVVEEMEARYRARRR